MGCIYYSYYPDENIYWPLSEEFPEKVYVGSATEFRGRTRRHESNLKNPNKKHHSKPFQRAFDKRNGELPIFVIFEDDIQNEDLLAWEQAAFEFFAYPGKKIPYYNTCEFAGNTYGQKVWLGRKHTAATKKRQSEAAKGRLASDEARRNMSESFKGRIYSDEYKDNMSISCQPTHCKNGHELIEENTIIEVRKSNGRTSRRCRICRNEYLNRKKLNE